MTDFTIYSSDDQSFKVHRVILGRSKYFASCFKEPFTEASSRELRLPENAFVVKNILQFVYERAIENFKHELGCAKINDTLVLYGAAGKYLLPNLKCVSYSVLQKRCTDIAPFRKYVSGSQEEWTYHEHKKPELFLDMLKEIDIVQNDYDIQRFRQYVGDHLRLGRVVFGLPQTRRRAIAEASPGFMHYCVKQYIQDYVERSGRNVVNASCAGCKKQWAWGLNGDMDAAVHCQFCGMESTWIECTEQYVVEVGIVVWR